MVCHHMVEWLMVLIDGLWLCLKESSIKEVIPFPKTNKGQDLMMDAPASVDVKVLEEGFKNKSNK